MHQNAPFACILVETFLGRGPSPLPRPLSRWGGDTPSPDSTPLGAYGASIVAGPTFNLTHATPLVRLSISQFVSHVFFPLSVSNLKFL